MANTTSIIWPLEPHTEIKHIILRRYLNSWLPIISRYHGKIVYIDGFAGPGEYSFGQDGSPIIAIKAVLDHKFKLGAKIRMLFIEKEEDRCKFLKEKIKKIQWLALAMLLLGVVLVVGIKAFTFGWAELMILAATLLWSVENIIAKKILRNISSEVVGLFRMGIGALMLISLSALTGKSSLILKLNANQLTYIVIGGTILSFYVYFWYKSLKSAPASLVTMILTFSVVVGNILNGAFAGIKIAEKDVLSSILITTGLMFVYLKIFAPFAHQFFKKDDN